MSVKHIEISRDRGGDVSPVRRRRCYQSPGLILSYIMYSLLNLISIECASYYPIARALYRTSSQSFIFFRTHSIEDTREHIMCSVCVLSLECWEASPVSGLGFGGSRSLSLQNESSIFHVEKHPRSAAAAWARARDENNVLWLGQYRRDVPRRLQTPVSFSLVEFSFV